MIVSHRLKFVFLGVPRTASRAMHVALKRLPGARQPWGGLHRMTIPPQAQDYFTFCCVRNPYPRLYSHYCCCWGQRRRWWAGRVRVRSFAEYLDVLAAGSLGGSCGSKYRSTVRGYTGENRLDATVRYEDLADGDLPAALAGLAKRASIPALAELSLPRRGCCLASDWAGQYDERLADRVFEIARADFEEFGYDPESWRAANVAAIAPGVFTGD
ncbi:MAG: sulfotransferase family 2 domain-containing protein [Pirellulales bacterium]